MTRQQTGALGETLAAEDYQKDGYTLLARNYRTRHGEIDLVVEKQGLLVFAEVKTRAAGALAQGREAVDARKQRRLALAAQQYLQQYKLGEPFVRFDVVEVEMPATGRPVICRIEDAFSL